MMQRAPFGVYTFTAPTSVCEWQTNPLQLLFARRADCNVKRSPGAKEARSTAQAGRTEPGLKSSFDANSLADNCPQKILAEGWAYLPSLC